jgi:hypothetical protein
MIKSWARNIFRKIPPVKRLLRYQTLWEPGHYYSAIPGKSLALEAIDKDAGPFAPKGIDLRDEAQLELLDELIPFMRESGFRNEEQISSHRFYNKNGIYGYSDALILEAMIRKLRPSRIVEAGSGFTSALMMDVNGKYFNNSVKLEFIEPYPERLFKLLTEEDLKNVTLRIQGLQTVDLAVFRELGEKDILFIDSTHVAKTGSDLLYLFFEILPILRSGVYIHFHDIFHRFEYQAWHFESYNGFAWNEDYFLRSFLMYNKEFEIVLFSNYLDSTYKAHIQKLMPDYPLLTGAQLWIRKR